MEIVNNTQELKCQNCEIPIQKEQKFCGNCGQKIHGITLELKDLLSNMWESVFNLDNSFFKSIKYIWAPWKLTRFYVQGKRRSFLNPVRLFLVTLLLHFGLLTSVSNLDNQKTGTTREYVSLEKSKMLEKHNNLLSKYPSNEQVCAYADTLNSVLFKGVKLPDDQQFSLMGTDLNLGFFDAKKYPITVKDAIELEPDSLFSKYGIHTFWEKLIIKQYIRLNLDRAGALKFVIGNIAWGVIPVILLLALIMKLLYFRQKRYFAEHAVLLMNVHSLAFVIVSVAIGIGYLADDIENFQPIIIIIILLMTFLTLYFYYKQGIFKTFLKYSFMGMSYIILLVFCLIFAAVVSLILY
jgi:hypothetical protein